MTASRKTVQRVLTYSWMSLPEDANLNAVETLHHIRREDEAFDECHNIVVSILLSLYNPNPRP